MNFSFKHIFNHVQNHLFGFSLERQTRHQSYGKKEHKFLNSAKADCLKTAKVILKNRELYEKLLF